MIRSRRTWCRTCGAELKLPWWKAAIGLNIATCPDVSACAVRFQTKRDASIAAGQERTRRDSSVTGRHRR